MTLWHDACFRRARQQFASRYPKGIAMIRFRSVITLSVALASVFFVAGCSMENSLAPESPPSQPALTGAPSRSLLGVLSAPTTVSPLRRKTALQSDITVSKTIGLLGGTLSIPAAGVTVVVPPLAVTTPTVFTMTARAGTAVAYDFGPHGIRFALPLVMTQNLTNMLGGATVLGSLQLGYYPNSSNITSVTELLSVSVDLLHTVGVATIWHFSGYMFAGGRSSDGDF